MAGVDSAAALSALLASSAAPQAITVNQRALIDKILARYAAEWTVFRELLQNADDAGATECHLRFESRRYHEYKKRRAAAASASSSDSTRATSQAQSVPASQGTGAASRSDGAPGPAPASAPATAATATERLPSEGAAADDHPPALDLEDVLHSWTFANDGMPFRTEDWARLRRIAEGNPDPERIGAFGVGYYSVFSICENPMVQSGGEIMGFFWDNDSLFTRRVPVPKDAATSDAKDATDSGTEAPADGRRADRWTKAAPSPETSCAGRPWTTFLLPLREPAPLPEHPLTLARFLATSLTFTARVRRVALHWDDRVLCEFEKTIDSHAPIDQVTGAVQTVEGSELPVPSNLNSISPGRMLRLERLSSSKIQISALHHPVLLASAKEQELETRRKRAKAAEDAQKSGLSAGAAAVAGLFHFGSSSSNSSEGSKRSGFSSFFGLGKKSTPAPPVAAPTPAPTTVSQPLPPVSTPAQTTEARRRTEAASQRNAKPVPSDVHFRIATAHLNVVAEPAFIKEIERSTKKPPPSKTAFSVVFADRDEVKRSRGASEDAVVEKETKTVDQATTESPRAGAVQLTAADERMLTNRHLFGTLLPWLSGAGLGDDAATSDALVKQGSSRGSVADDDAVARMAREQQGHVFIGFRTHQTTGFAGHLAARFIPTVERESLDFIDKYCRAWNEELLAMGGYLIRALYEREMSILGDLWTKEFKSTSNRPLDSDPKAKERASDLFERALHLLRFFTIRTSHPSGKVAEILQDRFFAVSAEGKADANRMFKFIQAAPTDADKAVRIMSTCGVWPSSKVRLPNEILTPFIKDLPMLPASHVAKAAEFVRSCTARGLLLEVQMPDVFKELESRPLDVDEMKACLKWFILVAKHPDFNPTLRGRLYESAVLTLPPVKSKDGDASEDGAPRIQPLGEVGAFLNPQRIPTGFPFPPSCLAYEVSRHFPAEDLRNIFLWKELTVSQWISHLVALSKGEGLSTTSDDENVQLSPAFSERVFVVLARAWGNISAAQQAEITSTLQAVTCIPTRNGMQRPQQAYFPSVSLFDDLPVVTFPAGSTLIKGNMEILLTALGVRKHVELQMIFTRLLAAGDWSHVELVTYLATNQATLLAEEKDRLKKTAMFPFEGDLTVDENGKPKKKRYRANQLYEPVQALRDLGLPVLDWSKPAAAAEKATPAAATDESRRVWRATSEEAKFLFNTLGLRRHPAINVLLEKAANPATTPEATLMRTKALAYLREKWDAVYAAQYKLEEASKFAFVPCLPASPASASTVKVETGSSPPLRLQTPDKAYTNQKAALLGFDVADPAFFNEVDAVRFKLWENPPANELLDRFLAQQIKDIAKARSIFEYFSRINTFTNQQYQYMRDKRFIPVRRADAKTDTEEDINLVSPTFAFFGSARVENLSYKDVFTFIDFGEVASYFLRNCGVTDEPQIEEVAQKLVRDPRRFFQLAGSSDSYLDILRQIASQFRRIPKRTRDDMKRSAFLLGSKRVPVKAEKLPGGIDNVLDQPNEDEPGVLHFDLLRPSQVVIADDANAHTIFGSDAFFAPHDELLEQQLYGPLGSPKLSSLVEETQSVPGTVLRESPLAAQVKAQVIERMPLFVYEIRKEQRQQVSKDADWIKKYLDVWAVEGRGLVRTRTFRLNGFQKRDTQYPSAITAAGAGGRLQLFVSVPRDDDLDWFELATAMVPHMLSRHFRGDVLLFKLVMESSLRDLKRHGFPVDRIMEQKEAEKKLAEQRMREAQEEAAREREAERKRREEAQRAASQAGAIASHSGNTGLVKQENRDPSGTVAGPSREYEEAAAAAAAAAAASGSQGGKGFLSKWQNRFKNGNDMSSLASGTSSISGMGNNANRPPPVAAAGRSASGTGGEPTGSGPTIVKDMDGHSGGAEPTPLDSINKSVMAAVNASRPDGSERIQSQVEKGKQIKEAESSYCDVGIAADLTKVGQVLGMNVYLSQEYRDPARTLADNNAALHRLIQQVYRPVGEGIFGVPPGVLNIFCDVEGPTIAFNRGGTIFLNLRFYLAWHDENVKRGEPGDAIISVFHSVAHELAHNLVTGHNSQHEYYTSAISERHFIKLGELLKRVGAL